MKHTMTGWPVALLSIFVAVSFADEPIVVNYANASSYDPAVRGNYCVTTLPTLVSVSALCTTPEGTKHMVLKWSLAVTLQTANGKLKEQKLCSGARRWKNMGAGVPLLVYEDISKKLNKKLSSKTILQSLAKGEVPGTLYVSFKGKTTNGLPLAKLVREAVIFNLDRYIPKGSVDVCQVVGPDGGTVTDSLGNTVVELSSNATRQAVAFTITRGTGSNGQNAVTIQSDKTFEGMVTINLTNLLPIVDENQMRNAAAGTFIGNKVKEWSSYWVYLKGYFTTTRYNYDNFELLERTVADISVRWSAASRLFCTTANESEMSGKIPILFTHGYSIDSSGNLVDLGGEEGIPDGNVYWDFPALLQEEFGNQIVIFDFRWNTNARFQDVAGDFTKAVDYINEKTGKKVHVIAHSFGGVMARTFLEGLAVGRNGSVLPGYEASRAKVASLVTVGTPHSGIRDSAGTMYGTYFPKGQDARLDVFESARQVSVHQAGEWVGMVAQNWQALHVLPDPGEIPAALYTGSLPNELPVYVLIGLTTDRDYNTRVDNGDGLISFEGQRFLPSLGLAPVITTGRRLGAVVTEHILGSAQGVTVRPNDYNPWNGDDFRGYRHTSMAWLYGQSMGRNEVEITRGLHKGHAVLLNIIAWLRSRMSVPDNMVPIPAGNFEMGNCVEASEGDSDELPKHTVYVSAFYMDKYEVSKAKWDEVYTWAIAHGYSFNAGSGKAATHPVQTVSWYDCVKWCNARSEKEGRTPCYTVGGNVYQTGQNEPDCNWSANGYRMPTEAEWEKAARGGAVGHRYPWSDANTITNSRANYYGDTSYSYDLGPSGYNPLFTPGSYPYTSPVGFFAPNGYGLYDMAGNVWEWCWDWYDASYYASSPGSDPRGLGSGTYRVLRGGHCGSGPDNCRVAARHIFQPYNVDGSVGFRCVRGL